MGIEYGVDVLLGMQLEGIDFAEGEKDKTGARAARIQALHEKVREAKDNGYAVRTELKILKNRKGTQKTLPYRFYTRYSLFVEEAPKKK